VTSELSAPSGFSLPSLLGESGGLYRSQPRNFFLSFLVHVLAGLLLVWTVNHVVHNGGDQLPKIIKDGTLVFPGEGGGGGGAREKLAAPRGAVPTQSMDIQLAPPTTHMLNDDPKLPEMSSVMVLPEIKLPQIGQLGDPLSRVIGPASDGPGSNSGVGTGDKGGIGPGRGPGLGPGENGNYGGLTFRPGVGGVTSPRVIFDPEPEYSDEARKLRTQGSVVLWLVVGADGHPRNIRVQHSLGLGLDEKAMAAVSQWRFEPAHLDGKPVPVMINVEVSFRLY
jgi:periplasmic protein TonB